MPSRLVSLLILVYWLVAAFWLLKSDVLPDLTQGYPPDLRGIAFASTPDRPVRWSIQILDAAKAEDPTIVGEAITSSRRESDGWFQMSSRVELEADKLLKRTILAAGNRDRLPVRIVSTYQVDPSGNLQKFDLKVESRDLGEQLLHVFGKLRKDMMEIASEGPLPILNRKFAPFKYQPRSVVSDMLGPIDRLPGLHLGQRWEMQVVNPFSGQVEHVRVEVTRRTTIPWAGKPETTYEVEQNVSGMKMRTWVRTDGVILRQEVPFPFLRLMLERRPDDDEAKGAPAAGTRSASGRTAG